MKTEHASQAGHWYTAEGKPCYTIIGKNGKERNTTLADARKLNLKPSVTEIIKLTAKPQLQAWIIDQHILSCLTTERRADESEKEYIARIKEDANEQARKASEKGTIIHAWVQSGFEGKKLSEEGMKYFLVAKKEVEEKVGQREWICEDSFATGTYGGKIDLESENEIIDIKTTEKDLTNIKTWPDQAMQLGAYDRGRGKRCGILYINVLTAEAKLIWIKEEEIKKRYKCFMILVDYWRTNNDI